MGKLLLALMLLRFLMLLRPLSLFNNFLEMVPYSIPNFIFSRDSLEIYTTRMTRTAGRHFRWTTGPLKFLAHFIAFAVVLALTNDICQKLKFKQHFMWIIEFYGGFLNK